MRRVGVTRLRKTRGESPRRLDPPGLVARFLRAGGRGRQPSIQCLRRPGGIETPAPFSPTRVFDPSCRHWPSPGVELAESEPGRRSTPHASPTAGEPDCEQVLTVFGHCSVPVASRPHPVGVRVSSRGRVTGVGWYFTITLARATPCTKESRGGPRWGCCVGVVRGAVAVAACGSIAPCRPPETSPESPPPTRNQQSRPSPPRFSPSPTKRGV
jgi:hypothetical protein